MVKKFIEKLEVFSEDLFIILTGFISILVILASVAYILFMNDLTSLMQDINHPLNKLYIVGKIIYPWVVMLALMLIARDLWITRKILQYALAFETKAFREIKKKIEHSNINLSEDVKEDLEKTEDKKETKEENK